MKKLICALMLALSLPVAIANMTESKPAANKEDADFVAGKKAIERKEWKSAVDALSRALKRMPESADIHNYLGYAYRHLDDLNLSFTHYKEALRIDPNHRGAHEYIGEAYLKAGQPDKAAEHLARLEQICGKRCEEYQDLAKSIGAYQKGK
jgi:tetratricopeptide (TPR) repeat protein